MATTNHSTEEPPVGAGMFDYSSSEFNALRQADIATSINSMICSTSVLLTFIYMLMYHRREAYRVSLRIVFVCCWTDLVNDVVKITLESTPKNTTYWHICSIVLPFTLIISTVLLTMVNLNLFLIFVIDIDHKDWLEWFYYVFSVIYSLIGISLLIYLHTTAEIISIYRKASSWTLAFLTDRTYNIVGWMWYYSFIFFVNIIAVFFSGSAMCKYYYGQRLMKDRFNGIAPAPNSGNRNVLLSEQINYPIKKRQQADFRKVVIRCIMYPLVPFLQNIFGFISQIKIITTGKSPGYPLVITDISLNNSLGPFVAVIFFTDPAITALVTNAYRRARQKYVAEYYLVPASFAPAEEAREKNKSIHELPTIQRTISSSSPAIIMTTPPTVTPHVSTGPSILSSSPPYLSSISMTNLSTQQPNASFTSISHRISSKKVVPMRRIDMKSISGNDERNYHHKMSIAIPVLPPLSMVKDNYNTDTIKTILYEKPPETVIFIPYKHPRCAKCIHFIMTRIFRIKVEAHQ